MPMPIWRVKNEHEGRELTDEERKHLLQCIGESAVLYARIGERYTVPQRAIEDLDRVDREHLPA